MYFITAMIQVVIYFMYSPHLLLPLAHSSKLYLMTKDAKPILKCLLAICDVASKTAQFTGSLADYKAGVWCLSSVLYTF